MDANKITRLAISLSNEELFVLMRMLNLPVIPHFNTGWVPELAQESLSFSDVTSGVLNSATLALIARGYIQLPDDISMDKNRVLKEPIKMPAEVIGLIASCAKNQLTFVVDGNHAGYAIQASFHWVGTFGVVHVLQPLGIHLFEATQTKESFIATLMASIGIANQPEHGTTKDGDVLQTSFENARQFAINQNALAAVQELINGGLSSAIAIPLSQSMADPTSYFTSLISLCELPDGKKAGSYMAILASSVDSFCITSKEMLPSLLHVQRYSVQDWQKIFQIHLK